MMYTDSKDLNDGKNGNGKNLKAGWNDTDRTSAQIGELLDEQ